METTVYFDVNRRLKLVRDILAAFQDEVSPYQHRDIDDMRFYKDAFGIQMRFTNPFPELPDKAKKLGIKRVVMIERDINHPPTEGQYSSPMGAKGLVSSFLNSTGKQLMRTFRVHVEAGSIEDAFDLFSQIRAGTISPDIPWTGNR